MIGDGHWGELIAVSGTWIFNLVRDTLFWPYQDLGMPVPSSTQVKNANVGVTALSPSEADTPLCDCWAKQNPDYN